jgi:hypothetical protein
MAKARLADASTGGDSVKQRALAGGPFQKRFRNGREDGLQPRGINYNIRQYMSYKIAWYWLKDSSSGPAKPRQIWVVTAFESGVSQGIQNG